MDVLRRRRVGARAAAWLLGLLGAGCAFDPPFPPNISCQTDDDCRPFGAICGDRTPRVCCRGPGCLLGDAAADTAVFDASVDAAISDGALADMSQDEAADLGVDGPASDQVVPTEDARDTAAPAPPPDVMVSDGPPPDTADAAPPVDRAPPAALTWDRVRLGDTAIYDGVAVAASAEGSAVVVLTTPTEVWARRRRPTALDPLFRLGARDAGGAPPVVAVDDSGNAMVVWAEGPTRGVARRFTAGAAWPTGWSEAEPIWSDAGVTVAALRMDAAGDAVVSWEGPAGVGLRLREAGFGWYNGVTALGAGDQVHADLARLGLSIRVLVSWRQSWSGSPATSGVFARIYGLSRETHLATPGPQVQLLEQPAAATAIHNAGAGMSDDGRALLIADRDGAIARIYDGAAWSADVPLSPIRAPLSLTVSRDGTALLGWYGCNPCVTRIARFSSNGWHSDTELAIPSAPLVRAAGERAVAVWVEPIDQAPSIVASERQPLLGWSTPHPLEQDNARNDSVTLSMAPDGTAVAVWLKRPSPGAPGEAWSARVR